MRSLFILALLLTSALASDSQLEGPGLSIELISENRSVTAGEPFTVGLHIHHFPGFHTYWKNPGNVGMATAIDWTLPEGFTASEISWPSPEKTFMADYPCHGYERDVTLLVTITPPDLIETSSIILSADTRWMCCAKGCFPGYQTFEMTLPVSAEARKDLTLAARFQKARSELPKANHQIKATLLSAPEAKIIKVLFTGVKKQKQENLYFFSSDGQISSDQKQSFTYEADGSLILTVPRSEYSPEKVKTLPGVLASGQHYFDIEGIPSH